MISKVFRNLAAALACTLAAAGASAKTNKDALDEALLGAYDAYRAGDAIKLSRYSKKLEGHVLEPWLEYWRLSMRLEDIPNKEVREFLATNANLYVTERLRADWLRVLGKRREWAEFDRQAARYARDDLEVSCYRWLGRLEREDESALEEALAMWLEPAELPEGCQRLSALLSLKGRLSVTDVWRRVRVLFEHGQITAAKTTLALLPKHEAPDERMLAEAARQPKRFIERLPKTLDKRPAREVAVLAAVRYARNDVTATAAALEGPLGQRLQEAELKYLWGVVAYEGAREHHNDALKWFERAGDTTLDDRQLAWKARAALRDSQWGVVRESVDRMSFGNAHQPAWVYWYGRALAAQGEEIGSRAYFLRIAGQTDFYGPLASEELGYVLTLPDITHVPS